MTAALLILYGLVALAFAGCGIYAEHSARKQPGYEFGKPPRKDAP